MSELYIDAVRDEDDEFDAAQSMAEWFSDYVYGFTDEIGTLPSITLQRLERQFEKGFVNDQIKTMKDTLMSIEEKYQFSLGLYICGFPDESFDGLSDVSLDELKKQLDIQIPVAKQAADPKTKLAQISLNSSVKAPLKGASVKPREQRAATPRREADADLFGLYLKEIGLTPLLSAQEEVELSKTIEAGLVAQKLLDGIDIGIEHYSATQEELEWLIAEGQRAMDTFTKANLRLVVSIGRKYSWAKMDMFDIVQEGNLGLMHAVKKFDYTKGYKFSTYATWWIRQSITRGVSQQSRTVRLPVHVQEEVNALRAAKLHLAKMLGTEDPDISDIASEMGVSEERVLDLMQWSKDSISLDKGLDDTGETSIGDLIADTVIPAVDDEVILHDQRSGIIELIYNTLDARSADIIIKRNGLIDGRIMKLAEIGRIHNLSGERIRMIEREALGTLRLSKDFLIDNDK